MVKGFSKMYNLSFFGQFFFSNIFTILHYFCKFADSKSRAQELSNDVSFVIFRHQTWDLEGGGKLTPHPQCILVFKYPSRDRVNSPKMCENQTMAYMIDYENDNERNSDINRYFKSIYSTVPVKTLTLKQFLTPEMLNSEHVQ